MDADRLTQQDLIRWSEGLAAIARTGLAFTQSGYERERYEEVLHVAAEIGAAIGRDVDHQAQVVEWMRSVVDGVPGYVTPKIAVGAVVANEAGEILLIQRSDSGHWLYPTGWADIGYSPAEVAIKEVLEETGIVCEVRGLLGVLDGMRRGFTRVPLYSVLFLAEAVGGELQAHPLECRDVGFFGPDDLPEPLAGTANLWDLCFRAARGEPVEPFFDPPRDNPWGAGG